MSDFPNSIRCETCGGNAFESLVQHGSYILRCRTCRTLGATTSWVTIGSKWNGVVKVFRNGEEAGVPILEGVGREIWQQIGRLASDGTLLVLR